MKKIEINIDWRLVFWISTFVVFLWLLAKAVGLIHTPWFIGAIPYVGAFIALAAIVKEAGKFTQKIDILVIDMGDVKKSLHEVDKRVCIVETKISAIEAKM